MVAANSDPMEDAEAWQALSPAEQDEYLDEGLARLKGDRDEGHWRHLSASAQRETIDAIEGQQADDDLSEAEAAMQAALTTTWTANLWEHADDVPTVPLECRELSDREQDIMTDGFRLMAAIDEQAQTAEDLEAITFDSEYFDSLEQFECWLFAFLADVTDDRAFDEERFRTGAGLRSGTRQELLAAIFFRYEEEARNAQKFRTE
ncbi:hypothetical protein [Haloarcula sp. 1CSR25-25]|uniref:hypothetical protein n=1 Tax=Haloarcula sp. 1CSR25-25 TaxID=2862545 RepID=UPI002894B155|nr:hypothetical protein [Haloarcula sp. 1CSR25-25]MDT3434686.1 hypothetical protein [Haloarcula sp. 1CSR25-25]